MEKDIFKFIVQNDQSIECQVVVLWVMKYMPLAKAVQWVCNHLSQIIPLQKKVTNMNAEHFPLPSYYYTIIDNKIHSLQDTLEEARQGLWNTQPQEDAQQGLEE